MGSCGLPPRFIRFAGREVAEARVRAFSIVILHPRADSGLAVAYRVEGIEVHALLLERAPQPLDEHVVQPAALAIHGDLNAGRLQFVRPVPAGELAALVRVEDLRLSIALQGGVQRFQAETRILGDRQLPRQHVARVPVHDRHQIHKAVRQWNVGDISAPDLVGRVDAATPEQIGVDRKRSFMPSSVSRFHLVIMFG